MVACLKKEQQWFGKRPLWINACHANLRTRAWVSSSFLNAGGYGGLNVILTYWRPPGRLRQGNAPIPAIWLARLAD